MKYIKCYGGKRWPEYQNNAACDMNKTIRAKKK